MALFNKEESYIGVDIGARGIKMVELRKNKGRPQLWTYGIADESMDIHLDEIKKTENSQENNEMKRSEDLPEEVWRERVDKYGAILASLWKETKATPSKISASLPVSQVFHAVITMPKVDENELDYHVKAKVKKMISRPIEDMQIVRQILPESQKDNKSISLLITAAPKSLINFYTSIFQKAGLKLSDLETEAFALERSLVGKDKATAMIVDIGAERTNFFIIDNGLPITHRSIQSGGNAISEIIMKKMGVENAQVQQIKMDIARLDSAKLGDIRPIFEPIIDPIVKEIQYSFNLFLGQLGNENKKPEKIILSGGSCLFPFFADIVKDNFPMKVFIGDPWARVVYQQKLKPVLSEVGPRMAVSIGLAMRNIV